MTDKVIKNPDRNKPEEFRRYRPAYQELGVEPEIVDFGAGGAPITSGVSPNMPVVLRSEKATKQRKKKSSIGQNSETLPEQKITPPLNIGNNMESWMSVSGEEIDEKTDPNKPIYEGEIRVKPSAQNIEYIDNNDYVLAPADVSDEMLAPKAVNQKSFLSEEDLEEMVGQEVKAPELIDALSRDFIEEGQYVLLVSGNIFNVGDRKTIQEDVRALVFGEHKICNGEAINANEIIVIKRVPVNIGVFLEE
jgi:hypothetical protein